MGHTVLAFHAHPDDESLLTGGTLAKAAAEGHRVVLVTATDGALGLARAPYAADLAAARERELRCAAYELGVHRVEMLGYADSGMGAQLLPDPPGKVRFVRAPVDEAAQRLAELLREEQADVLLSYDVNGGYGHRDHARVHEVGARAAELAGTPRVLEALVSPRVARVMKPRGLELAPVPAPTHVVDVRPYVAAKVRAIRCHRSQLESGSWLPRNNDLLTRLPLRVLERAIGWERFADPAAPRGIPNEVRGDIFAGL